MSEPKRQMLIEIYHLLDESGKVTSLQWKFHSGVHGDFAEQIFKTCADVQMKENLKNQIKLELNKTKIVRPNMPAPNLQGILK